MNGSPPSRRRTRPSPRPVTGTRAQPAGCSSTWPFSVPAGRSIRNTTVSTKSRACRTPRGSATPITSCGEMMASRWRWWEAKKTTVDPAVGRQQAKLYADCLEAMHGQRPIIFYTNGYETYIWDDQDYTPRALAGFYKKDELASLLHRRVHREPLDVARVKNAIVERYYQKRAIGSLGEQFSQARRRALLVMATGSGKTRVAVALVDLLQRAGWVKRALFLADRVSLGNQAVGAFKAHLPESSPVNLVTEKDKAGRVYVCTYPTMMGLIDETTGSEARFGVGHFDLVIIDEAHRSVYQKYGAIFRYFDSLLVGLTATPRDQVRPEHLRTLRPRAGPAHRRVRTRDRGGGRLSRTAEGAAGESPVSTRGHRLRLAQRGRADPVGEPRLGRRTRTVAGCRNASTRPPSTVGSSTTTRSTRCCNISWSTATPSTVATRLAKTIIFARNHDHATFIEARFNHHYPQYAGHFARIIDHYATYPQSLLDDFRTEGQGAAHRDLRGHARYRHRRARGRQPGLLQAGLFADQVLADESGAERVCAPICSDPRTTSTTSASSTSASTSTFSARIRRASRAVTAFPSAPGSSGRACSC